MRVAVTQRIQHDGEWRDGDTSFLKVNVWRGQAEHLADSLSKGDRVMVTGRLRQRSWETPDGDKRSVTEIEADEVGASLKWATAKVERRWLIRRVCGRDEPRTRGCSAGVLRQSSSPPNTSAHPQLRSLVQQSQFSALLLVVGAASGGLMASSPDRPGEGEHRVDRWAPDRAGQQPAQLGDGERHQHAQRGHHHRPPTPPSPSGRRARVTARNASATIARVTCRYQAS
jgi:single stranded DNA-binding protein